MKEVRVVRTYPFMMVVEGDTQYKVEFTVSSKPEKQEL